MSRVIEQANICIREKPDWISYDEIAALLHDAHRSTLEKGMHYSIVDQNGDDVKRRIGNGKIFVALIDGNVLAGVTAVSLNTCSNIWYIQGKPYAEIKLIGVKTQYKKMGLMDQLQHAAVDFAFQHVDVLTVHTAHQNTIVLNYFRQRGWKPVDFSSSKLTNFYSVFLAKWKLRCPYSSIYCYFRYALKKLKILLTKDKNGEQRF